MKHVFRFFGTATTPTGHWDLEESDAHHAQTALRLGVGDIVEVGDGRGHWCRGEIVSASKRRVSVLSQEEFSAPAPKNVLTVAVGALRAGTLDDLLAPLTEIGVNSVAVFAQAGTAKFLAGPAAQVRWQRIVDAAAKQCKTPWVPTISLHASLSDLLAAWTSSAAAGGTTHTDANASTRSARIYLDPAGPANLSTALAGTGQIYLVVGSEMGLRPEEIDSLKTQGFAGVAIGRHVLRAWTAALASAAIVRYLHPESVPRD